MKGITNKEIKTKNGILIIIAATLIILGGILLTNIDLIFGAGIGDADTLDSMDWDGTECSQADPACNIKAYVDSKSTPCLADNGGQCYVSQASKSALDTDLAAGNIKSGINIFGVAGSVVAKDPLASSQCFYTMNSWGCNNGATNLQTSSAYCIARGFTGGHSVKNDSGGNGCTTAYWNANTWQVNYSCNLSLTNYGIWTLCY